MNRESLKRSLYLKILPGVFILLSLGTLTGCAEQKEQSNAITIGLKDEKEISNGLIEDKELEENSLRASELYQEYSSKLQEIDQKREECSILNNKGWEYAKDGYCELITETMFGMCEGNNYNWWKDELNRMNGILAAEETTDEGGSSGFGMRIAVAEKEEIWEYGYFEYEHPGMIYITCRRPAGKEEDVAEYQVCEEVLYYGKVSKDSPEDCAEWEKRLSGYEEKMNGETIEYCVMDGHIYQIDREQEQFLDMAGQVPEYMAKWLKREKERVYYAMKVTSEAVEKAKALLPAGYSLQDEGGIAVCDLNHDGMDDYVVSALCSADSSSETMYMQPEDLFLFLSDGDGDYKEKTLVNGRICCYRLEFVADGMLLCENIMEIYNYGDPLKIDYFFFDAEKEDFYIDKVYQCKRGMKVLMEEKQSIGDFPVGEYYGGMEHEAGSGWEPVPSETIHFANGKDVVLEDDVIYRNANEEIAKKVNDSAYEVKAAIADRLMKEFEEDITIRSDVNYLGSSVYSGYMVGTVWESSGSIDFHVPLIMDLNSGEVLDITELMAKTDMVKVCQKGMKDKYRNELSGEEAERGIRLIETEYERAIRVTQSKELILAEENNWVYFEVIACGLRVVGEDDAGPVQFVLDKEYFIDTPLWQYMEPNLP